MLEMTLLLANAEGALVRVLGVIERRGFRFGAMNARPTPHGLHVTLTLTSEGRAADVLLRQVKRIHDVLEASFDVARPVFTLPPNTLAASAPMPRPSRRGISFLGIPERISAN